MVTKKMLKKLTRSEIEQGFLMMQEELTCEISKLDGEVSKCKNACREIVKENGLFFAENKGLKYENGELIRKNEATQEKHKHLCEKYDKLQQENQRLVEENKNRMEDQQLAISDNKELKAQIANIKMGMSIATTCLEQQGDICIMNQNLICENSNLKEENGVLKRELASAEEDRDQFKKEKEEVCRNNKAIVEESKLNSQSNSRLREENEILKALRNERHITQGMRERIKDENNALKVLSFLLVSCIILFLVLYSIQST